MAVKEPEIYQGSDWSTYRWHAAQAFDTLDRIRDLCLQMPVVGAPPATMAARSPYEMPEEEIADVFGYIAELCDDLSGELDAVQADLFPFLRNNVAHRWLAFEMRLNLGQLRTRALKEAEAGMPSAAPMDAFIALVVRIKELLKQIDQ
jgi:hypothetical protein